MLKKIVQVRNIYSTIVVSFVLFLSSHAFAANVIDKPQGGSGIMDDQQVQMWVTFLNWILSSGGAAYAALLGYGALKHIKHGEYGQGFSGLTSSFLAGGITYFVHAYFLK
jgi:hypothetical protein